MPTRMPWLLAAAASVGVLVTALIALVPQVHVAYEEPVLRVVLDTVVTLVALLLAVLIYGRFKLRRLLVDLLLVYALAFAALMNALFAVAPQLGGTGSRSLVVLAWGPLAGRLLVAAAFVAAAWVHPERRTALRNPRGAVAVACLASAAVIAVVLWLLLDTLATSAVPDTSPVAPAWSGGGQQGIWTALSLAAALLLFAAAAGFARRRDDALAPTLAASLVLLGFARLNPVLVPSFYPQWVYAGDALHLAGYGLLLVAAATEIRGYWQGQARAETQEQRRALARTLHDGLAQELSLVATQTRLWADGRSSIPPRLLAGAAERALDESRSVIHALTGDISEPLHVALLRVADDLEGRVGIRIATDITPTVQLPQPVQAAVVRATREAILNAARHAGVNAVDVRMSGGCPVLVEVTDRGYGFEPDAPHEGFGLATVRSRLASVGGELRVLSAFGEGTRVEVEVPCPT